MKTILFIASIFACMFFPGCCTTEHTYAPVKNYRPGEMSKVELRFRNQEDQDYVTKFARGLPNIFSVENKNTESIVLVVTGRRLFLEAFCEIITDFHSDSAGSRPI